MDSDTLDDYVVDLRVHVHAIAAKYDDSGVTDDTTKYNAYVSSKTFTPSDITKWVSTIKSTLGLGGETRSLLRVMTRICRSSGNGRGDEIDDSPKYHETTTHLFSEQPGVRIPAVNRPTNYELWERDNYSQVMTRTSDISPGPGAAAGPGPNRTGNNATQRPRRSSEAA